MDESKKSQGVLHDIIRSKNSLYIYKLKAKEYTKNIFNKVTNLINIEVLTI